MSEKTLGQVAYEQTPSAAWSDWDGQIGAVKVCWQAVADAVVAAYEARRWKEISTAPLTGEVLVGKWHRGAWTWKRTEFIAVAIEDCYTHWTDIPEPPQEVE